MSGGSWSRSELSWYADFPAIAIDSNDDVHIALGLRRINRDSTSVLQVPQVPFLHLHRQLVQEVVMNIYRLLLITMTTSISHFGHLNHKS